MALPIGVDIGTPITSFGDLRTAELTPILQGTFEYTVDNTDLNKNTVEGSGTVTQNEALAIISSGNTIASTAMFTSKQPSRYRSGFGGVTRFSALFSDPIAETEMYIGLLDERGSSAAFKNGYCIGYDGEVFGFHRFQNDTKITVPLSSWSDPLDGSGVTGMTLDPTTLNVFAIRFQFLGAGAIEIYVENEHTGRLQLVHVLLYANKNIIPSTFNPNYFMTYFVSNDNNPTDVLVKSGGYSYFTEGKTRYFEIHQPHNSSGQQKKADVTTEIPILTIRNKVSYAGKTSFLDILLDALFGSIEANSANNLGCIRVLKNTTLVGESFVDINTTNSIVELDTSATSFSGGSELVTIPLAGKNDKFMLISEQNHLVVNPGESITITGTSNNLATIAASLIWVELF